MRPALPEFWRALEAIERRHEEIVKRLREQWAIEPVDRFGSAVTWTEKSCHDRDHIFAPAGGGMWICVRCEATRWFG